MTEQAYKTAYSYDPATGEQAGESRAWQSPLEPGVYHLPANATYTAPPAAAEKQKACWDEAAGEWALKPDYRGAVYYNKATKERTEIKELGISPSAELTELAPADPESTWSGSAWIVPFDVLKRRKKAAILAYYDGIMAQAKQGYSGGEIDTWDIQRKGAADILAGNTSTTEAQFVATLAANRSAASGQTITAVYLAQRIQANVAAAQALNLAALGKQQGQYDLASAATTEAELDAIVCSFDMEA